MNSSYLDGNPASFIETLTIVRLIWTPTPMSAHMA